VNYFPECKGSAKCPTATFDELNPVAKSLTRPHFSECKTKARFPGS